MFDFICDSTYCYRWLCCGNEIFFFGRITASCMYAKCIVPLLRWWEQDPRNFIKYNSFYGKGEKTRAMSKKNKRFNKLRFEFGKLHFYCWWFIYLLRYFLWEAICVFFCQQPSMSWWSSFASDYFLHCFDIDVKGLCWWDVSSCVWIWTQTRPLKKKYFLRDLDCTFLTEAPLGTTTYANHNRQTHGMPEDSRHHE